MISLNELLEIKEFKHCPFKKFLPYAFDLDPSKGEFGDAGNNMV